ncbi:DUF2272 domain-containing protein [Vibrio natriegens]|uniref:DUF2272 domain-containing protein n=1 Tax=Vibrio natriegens TaxID=691 RepID=UPI003908BF5F
MDEFDRVKSMLDEANISFNAAKGRGDSAAASDIETTVIDPLKSTLAGLALAELVKHSEIVKNFSEKLELALVRLQLRVDRLFADRLIEKARELGLAFLPAAHLVPTPSPRKGSVNVKASAAGRFIDVTDTDLCALQRVVCSEVGHFGKYGEAQLRGGAAAVVDTILNRVAHSRWPDTIQAVIDQPKQFSAINDTGSWTGLPDATPIIARIVEEHLLARASGTASEIKGATHFLNPHQSSSSALAAWGNYVVSNAVSVYGSEENKDVHYHGFAPGTSLPPDYVLARSGCTSVFASVGCSPGGPSSNTEIRNAIVRICRDELARFGNGKAKETDDPQYLRVGDYWAAVGLPNNGRTLDSNGKRPAWSAAFISFVLKEAGAGDRFEYSVAHCHYFQHFVDLTGPSLYEAAPVDNIIPSPGDILHYGRSDAARHDFAAACADYGNDSFYPSHSSFVVEVDLNAGLIRTIGGNEGNSVKLTTHQLDKSGYLKPRKSGNNSLPWIGLLRLT